MVVKSFRNIDLYFTNGLGELATLQHYHELVERELPAIIAARGLPAWNGKGPTPGRIAIAQIYQMIVDDMLPMVLRGPLLISLWSIYESSLIEMAEFLRVPANLSFGLVDRKLPKHIKPPPVGIISRGLYIYETELGLNLFVNQQEEQQIRGLYGLRNILAHAGGRRRSSVSTDWNRVKAWASQESGVQMSRDRIWVEAEFVRVQIERVQSATSHIVQQVRQKIQELGIAD